MIFNSLAFLVFAAVFFPVYFATRGQVRMTFLVLASYFFYGWWDWRFCGLLALSTVVDYLIGLGLGASDDPRRRKALLGVSLAVNLGILATFKYFNFFSDSFTSLAGRFGMEVTPFFAEIILPVGISFYTFQTLSYSIDLYRRKIDEPEKSFMRFAAYVAMFPQLVAGPIVRAAHVLPQLKVDQRLDWSRIGLGLQLIVWGFFLKLCLADNAAQFVAPRFDEPSIYTSPSLILAVVLFAFQIYGDFAGYSLIAIGLGLVMGFDLGINFNRPYHATSFSDFWARWHISLSSWFRDYLYIPLGGNRSGRWRTLRNLVITMGLAGLWHGAAWTFVVWGLLHGAYLVIQRLVGEPLAAALRRIGTPALVLRIAAMVVVFIAVCIAWVPFRAEDFSRAGEIYGGILSFDDEGRHFGGQRLMLLRVLAIICFVYVVDSLTLLPSVKDWAMVRPVMRTIGVAFLLWAIALLGAFEGNIFIYFQF